MREKENLMSEEEKLRKYSMKQQTLIQELRRKLAMFNSDLKQDFKKGKNFRILAVLGHFLNEENYEYLSFLSTSSIGSIWRFCINSIVICVFFIPHCYVIELRNSISEIYFFI